MSQKDLKSVFIRRSRDVEAYLRRQVHRKGCENLTECPLVCCRREEDLNFFTSALWSLAEEFSDLALAAKHGNFSKVRDRFIPLIALCKFVVLALSRHRGDQVLNECEYSLRGAVSLLEPTFEQWEGEREI